MQSRFSVVRTSLAFDREQREMNAWLSTDNIVTWLAGPTKIGGPVSRRWPESRLAQHEVERDILTQLSELIVHQQDVRRAVDAPRTISSDRLRAVLDFTASRMGILSVTPRGLDDFPKSRIHGLRFVATDFDWAYGSGAEVRGPGEALVMAINGRHQALADLSGPGIDDFAQRVAGWSAKFANA